MINIRAGTEHWELSNFTQRDFVFRSVKCGSMEGLLQSLKIEDPERQRERCLLYGRIAYRAGKELKWDAEKQPLWWQGKFIDRHSDEYQDFIDEAYTALFTQNAEARTALLATGDEKLGHTVGKTNPKLTILTRSEFLTRLTYIRTELRALEFVSF